MFRMNFNGRTVYAPRPPAPAPTSINFSLRPGMNTSMIGRISYAKTGCACGK